MEGCFGFSTRRIAHPLFQSEKQSLCLFAIVGLKVLCHQSSVFRRLQSDSGFGPFAQGDVKLDEIGSADDVVHDEAGGNGGY